MCNSNILYNNKLSQHSTVLSASVPYRYVFIVQILLFAGLEYFWRKVSIKCGFFSFLFFWPQLFLYYHDIPSIFRNSSREWILSIIKAVEQPILTTTKTFITRILDPFIHGRYVIKSDYLSSVFNQPRNVSFPCFFDAQELGQSIQ